MTPTRIVLPANTVRNDLRKPHDLRVGDRVRAKKRHDLTGTVAVLPNPRKPIVKLGRHVIGNEMGVDLDRGGRAVGDVDDWEVLDA